MDTNGTAPDAPRSREAILEELKGLLKTALMLESTAMLGAETRFREDLQADSLGMVDIIIAVEEGFDIKLQSDLNFFDEIRTLGDAVELIEKRLGETVAARSPERA